MYTQEILELWTEVHPVDDEDYADSVELQDLPAALENQPSTVGLIYYRAQPIQISPRPYGACEWRAIAQAIAGKSLEDIYDTYASLDGVDLEDTVLLTPDYSHMENLGEDLAGLEPGAAFALGASSSGEKSLSFDFSAPYYVIDGYGNFKSADTLPLEKDARELLSLYLSHVMTNLRKDAPNA